jgi:transmembrane sensor
MNSKTPIQDNIQNLISSRLKQDIPEQVADAAQVITEIESVDSRKAYLQIQDRIQRGAKYKLLINFLVRAAAVLFIPLLIATATLLYRLSYLNPEQKFAMQEITTPSGVRTHLMLPDGSSVSLNAESTIKFRVPFDQTTREVSLAGEAFFEVRKNSKVPFVVKSGNVNVTVLGTRFNCKAYGDENSVAVVLAEGNVSLNTNGGKTGEAIIMKPGDRVVFDKSSNQTVLTNGNIEKYIDWHNGKLVFDETPMPEVATQIGRWFGVEITVDDPQIKNYKLTTTFENESLHQILELIKLSSPIEIKYVSATINKSNQAQTKSRVIFGKKLKTKN